MPKTLNQVAALTASLSLMFALACSGATPAQVQSKPAETTVMEKLEVVSTSNIVADWVRVVGQDRVDVFSLLPPNADPHTFRPGTQDVTRVVDADLVLSIGLSLEAGWLSKLVKNASQDPNSVVALGEFVDPIEFAEIFGEEEDHEEEKEGHGHGTLDPHFWFDPLRVKQAVNRIATQTLDPGSGRRDVLPGKRRRLYRATGRTRCLDPGGSGNGAAGAPAAGYVTRLLPIFRTTLRFRGCRRGHAGYHPSRTHRDGVVGTYRDHRTARRTRRLHREVP